MSDESAPEVHEPVPVEAQAATAEPVAAETVAPAPRKRRLWPFIVGGAVVLAAILTGLVIGVVTLLSVIGGSPSKTVTDYDLSFQNSDCELFTSTTTEQFQKDFFGGTFDCDAFVENADALTVDGVYSYDVTVVISSVKGETAEVVTTETDTSAGDPIDFSLRYHLVNEGGRWLIESIDNETPE